jgi:hypothetical protein
MYRLHTDHYIGIVQDDCQDLAQEIANQARIYQNGVLTILAGGAASVNEGFLHRQPQPKPHLLYNVSIQMPNNKKVCLQFKIQRREWGAERDPVNSRAWIFQEGTLMHHTFNKHVIDM